MKKLFTSESVTEGHPDKICDQISDAVLDAILAKDPQARVACESIATTGMVLVMGEISTQCYVPIEKIARDTIIEIGYDKPEYGFDGNSCAVLLSVDEQSPDIAMGVNDALETRAQGRFDIGAGDQGMMFGYACDETPEFMPLPIYEAHRLTRRLAAVRKAGTLPYLRPDGKAQVTVEYDENNQPVRIDTVVLSTQHSEGVSHEQIERDMIEHVIRRQFPRICWMKTRNIILILRAALSWRATGRFRIDGRKIIVDTYGGMGRHGGGAFSGKDPTKVDRSAAYALRHAAKNVVAAGWPSAAKLARPMPSRGASGFDHGGHVWHRRHAGRGNCGFGRAHL